MLGRAYRDGELVCGRVELLVGQTNDERLGLAPRERRYIAARFREGLTPGLRGDLEQLVEARGPRGWRLAEVLAPIELVVDDHGEERRVVGGLEPPTSRNRSLHEINFRLRQEVAYVKGASRSGVAGREQGLHG